MNFSWSRAFYYSLRWAFAGAALGIAMATVLTLTGSQGPIDDVIAGFAWLGGLGRFAAELFFRKHSDE